MYLTDVFDFIVIRELISNEHIKMANEVKIIKNYLK